MGKKEAQTEEEKKKRAVSPSTTHNWLYIFFSFYILGEIEQTTWGKYERAVPQHTHGEEEAQT